MRTTANRETAQAVVTAAVAAEPRFFFEHVLECRTVFPRMVEMMDAVRDERQVSVVGANGSGKDYTAGRLVLWWMHSRSPAKVLVYGPTHRQVHDVVWREVRLAFHQAPRIDGYGLRGKMFQTSRYEIDDSSFALGFATDEPFNLQGFHSPNLLVVVTEAHAVPQADVDALRRLMPACILMTGNPLTTSGPFYDSHHTARDRWVTVSISAFDTPNLNGGSVPGMVTPGDVAALKAEWGEENPFYVASVLGQFPENLEDSLIPLSAVLEAVQAERLANGPVILGCDVARFGQDKTVVVRRQGQRARIIWRVQGRDTMQITGWLSTYVRDHPEVAEVVVDDTGLGGGVVDRLREVGVGQARLVPFRGGASARQKDRFVNAVAEAWWTMRMWFLAGADIEDDQTLTAQLVSRQYMIQSDRRIGLESKTKLATSPDEADALSMTMVFRPPPSRVLQTVYSSRRRDNPLGLDLSDPRYTDQDTDL